VTAKKSVAPMAIAALGVVFGDIGTSPLYTLKTCFTVSAAATTLSDTLGILSLIAWALIIVVCIKYVTILMRVDNDGDGGILALLALAAPPQLLGGKRVRWLVWVVVIGGAMLIGDGMITPAISVISAVEGLGVATSAAQPYIVPISAVVLLALFMVQSRGTQRVGNMFGPIMLIWFVAIGVAGGIAIAGHPQILAGFNPYYALYFVSHHGVHGFLIFGAVILCLTGAEALYADLSHFGRIPITRAWYGVVFPALLLNYFGQGANVLGNPRALDSPFYALTGGWTLLPMVVLATLATVIASQSLISGAFTLTEQAIALNLCPRLLVIHTSEEERGQVYVPVVNTILAIVCIVLVVTFRSSDRLASAYGLAVACTMLATSVALFAVETAVYKRRMRSLLPWIGVFFLIDTLFVASGLPKFLDGAWVPIAISAIIATCALTWLGGRRRLAESIALDQVPVAEFLQKYVRPTAPVGTAVLLTRDPTGVPFVGHHPWIPAILGEQRIVLLNVLGVGRPYVQDEQRVTVERIAPEFFVAHARFGYMEPPRIKPIVRSCAAQGLALQGDDTAFCYAVPAIVPGRHGMPRWQRDLFAFLQLVSRPLTEDLRIPPNRRVGLAIKVAI
jgi:KUP system potassium uptake protein